jgi:hypothetical protein
MLFSKYMLRLWAWKSKDKAAYLIDRGYAQGKTVEELAKEIYENNG